MTHHPPPDLRSPERLVAAGVLRRHGDGSPHPALGGSPISYVSLPLWAALTALAIAPNAAEATATALLRAIADQAVDAALAPGNERAPRDDLYVAAPAHIGPYRRTVWFQRSGPRGPITASFPP
ncbi:hypothetical protein VM98_31550 [Streptomyces rubellomurinus subsp. indigoferus]|uniref:Uncharacterized protein n=1 Tax=Streptomyces rubellomurinus (strain ATCC 31215) TaxID=359131 RepID=A0A0F2TEV5_STRR3|nr:hypothetical protein [Streptomyces rubellomurinus]KJS52423.1 hypothetical protein VM98_31550 [Streptomyces rubellomurinus subsp. indigoferus]KJS60262.1 hypothetical protein VM95_22255 [Streptomyces rubellomurinus]